MKKSIFVTEGHSCRDGKTSLKDKTNRVLLFVFLIIQF